ncbi:Hypothetical_protein [Hexamita inflata]|uniref:Hypothetical_protein n=1 Tax=Hexamita inflata TaxID=28002 RepID=A0ABP1I7L0_9EUKA
MFSRTLASLLQLGVRAVVKQSRDYRQRVVVQVYKLVRLVRSAILEMMAWLFMVAFTAACGACSANAVFFIQATTSFAPVPDVEDALVDAGARQVDGRRVEVEDALSGRVRELGEELDLQVRGGLGVDEGSACPANGIVYTQRWGSAARTPPGWS